MKIVYLANARIPTEKAHGLQIMKMSEAFGGLGLKLTLVVPRRANRIKEDAFSYYGIRKNFDVKRIFCFDFNILHRFSGRLTYFFRTFVFLCRLLFNQKIKEAEVIYSREMFSVLPLFLFGKKVFYEMHDYPAKGRSWQRFFLKKAKGIIVTNHWKKESLIRDFNLAAEKILVSSNAVDLKDFSNLPNKTASRAHYQIPQNKIVLAYIGRLKTLGMTKGMETVLLAFKEALKNNSNLFLVCAGGEKGEIDDYQNQVASLGLSGSVKFLPHLPFNRVREYYGLADIFLLPYPKNNHYNFYMSPLKLFEYAACQKPMICSDLSAVREIFSGSEVSYFEPDNFSDLKEKILALAESAARRQQLALNALAKIQNYTWPKRAEKIIDFINQLR